jgi:hypothetical protein
MPKYTVKQGEDLGSIAEKYCLPSWKYLYELNKDAIGDNPDLLKPGARLSIPEWNATSGDEKIEAKGAKAFAYTGGLRYRYVWAPLSVSLVDENEQIIETEEEKEAVIAIADAGSEVCRKTLKSGDDLCVLAPDTHSLTVSVDGLFLRI